MSDIRFNYPYVVRENAPSHFSSFQHFLICVSQNAKKKTLAKETRNTWRLGQVHVDPSIQWRLSHSILWLCDPVAVFVVAFLLLFYCIFFYRFWIFIVEPNVLCMYCTRRFIWFLTDTIIFGLCQWATQSEHTRPDQTRSVSTYKWIHCDVVGVVIHELDDEMTDDGEWTRKKAFMTFMSNSIELCA